MSIKIWVATSCMVLLAATTVMAQTSIRSDDNSVRINASEVSVASGDRVVNIRMGNSKSSRDRNIRRERQHYDSRNVQQQGQQTRISLSSNDLKKPHILKVSIPKAGNRLTGQIKVNGKVVKALRNNPTQMNLSPQLSRGRYVIEISGSYPTNSSVTVEFSGPNTQVSQQAGGSGTIRHTLIIDVK